MSNASYGAASLWQRLAVFSLLLPGVLSLAHPPPVTKAGDSDQHLAIPWELPQAPKGMEGGVPGARKGPLLQAGL